MSSITKDMQVWNTIKLGERWAYTKSDLSIHVVPKASKGKSGSKRTSLLNIFDIMRRSLIAAFPSETGQLSIDNLREIENLKKRVHERYTDYRTKRSNARKVWDAITDIFLKKLSVKHTYKALSDELYRVGDITLEPLPRHEEEPAAAPPVEPEHTSAADTTNPQADAVTEPATAPPPHSDNPEEPVVAEEPIPEPTPEEAQEPSTQTEAAETLPAWECFLLCDPIPAETEKLYLHVTATPRRNYQHAWPTELFEDLEQKKPIAYHLFVPRTAAGEAAQLWDNDGICRSSGMSQNTSGWRRDHQRIDPNEFMTIVDQHLCELQDDPNEDSLGSFSDMITGYVRRCLAENKDVALIVDGRAFSAEALQECERIAADSDGHFKITPYDLAVQAV